MSEWWTYRLSDFLMFAPRTYHRLFELYNADLWPAHALALAAAAALLAAGRSSRPEAARAALAGLALCWCFVGWAFHWQRYAQIFTAAPVFAAAFALQGGLLAVHAWRPGARFEAGRAPSALLLVALAGLPLLGLAAGRTLAQAEVFALAPDPTAAATLAVLAVLKPPAWWLWPLPLAWCAVSGVTLWAMDAPDALLPPLLAAAALVLAVRRF